MDRIFPITFSIPAVHIVPHPPVKNKIMASIIPGRPYAFENQAEYYQEYKNSYFAWTCKKAGWDCMRHYEILACGCIPYFPDIDKCPENTLFFFPKHLIRIGNRLYESIRNKTVDDLSHAEIRRIGHLADRLLEYTQTFLTSHRMAQYMMGMIGADPESARILFLSGCTLPDYLRCLTLTGLKEMMGARCHDYPRVDHIYQSVESPSSLYGKGFTYTGLLPVHYHDTNRDQTVIEDIKRGVYDFIIYGNMHRGLPLWDVIMASYDPHRIVLMCGEDIDIMHRCPMKEYAEKGHFVFVREME